MEDFSFFFLKGERLSPAKKTDLEFSLGVQETSLRTIDSELGSESGSFLYVLGNQSFGLKVYVDLKENNKVLFHIKSQKLKYM